jgi:hypothetical protein
LTAKDIYEEVEYLTGCYPEASLDGILLQVTDAYGLTDEELLKRYSKIRETYDKAKAWS